MSKTNETDHLPNYSVIDQYERFGELVTTLIIDNEWLTFRVDAEVLVTLGAILGIEYST